MHIQRQIGLCCSIHLRLQDDEDVDDPGHGEHVLVGMERSHDLVHSILWLEHGEDAGEPGGADGGTEGETEGRNEAGPLGNNVVLNMTEEAIVFHSLT